MGLRDDYTKKGHVLDNVGLLETPPVMKTLHGSAENCYKILLHSILNLVSG